MLIPAVGACVGASSSCNMITKCMLMLGVNGACEAVFTLTSSFFQTAYFLSAYFSAVHCALQQSLLLSTSQYAYVHTHERAKCATYALKNLAFSSDVCETERATLTKGVSFRGSRQEGLSVRKLITLPC